MTEPWIKLQRNLPRHPRAAEAGASAMWLFVCGLCYCDEFTTDGRIHINAIAGLSVNNRNAKRDADQLVKVGLWERDGDHFLVRNYLEKNRSAAEIQASKQEQQEAGRRGAAKRWAKEKYSQPYGVPHSPPHNEGHRVFIAEEEVEEERDLKTKTLRSFATQNDSTFEDFWTAYPTQSSGPKPGKKQAREQWNRLTQDQRTQALNSLTHYKTHLQITGTETKHAFRWLRDKLFEDYTEPPHQPDLPQDRSPNQKAFDKFKQDLDTNPMWGGNGNEQERRNDDPWISEKRLPEGEMGRGPVEGVRTGNGRPGLPVNANGSARVDSLPTISPNHRGHTT